MRMVISIICWALPTIAFSQVNDSLSSDAPEYKMKAARPEILSGGFIDIAQNGQMNASAMLFRLYIGEPGKFQLPLSVYTGVSANNFSNSPASDDILLNLINPASGIFNMCFDGNNKLIGGKRRITSLHLQYQTGLRFLNVYDKLNFTNTTFFNLISGLGIIFVTGAWERNKAGNLGLCWFNFRGLYSNNPPLIIRSFFAGAAHADMFGYSCGLGIEISQTLNVKMFYFRFLNNRSLPAFQPPFLQLSLNYSVR